MNNPVIQTDIAELLGQINQKLDKLTTDVTDLKIGQAKIEGKISAIDEKLSGQIKTLDEKVSGQKEVVEKTTAQLDKRINNQEFLNRAIGGSLVISIVGGLIGFFWMATRM